MAFLSIIRRWALREHLSIREIARRTKLSRKQRRTSKQLHDDLVKLGYTGSYGRVAAFARVWRADRQREQQTTGRGTFVPLVFQTGEAFQFDWSEDFAVLGGDRAKLQVAHIKLSHSLAFLLRAYPLQTHEMLFDAHVHGFRVFGGVPGRGIYDSEAWPPWVRGQAERRQRLIVSAGARNGRSMPGSWRWPATMCSSPSFVTLQRVGRKARSRRTCRIPVTGFGSPCRSFLIYQR